MCKTYISHQQRNVISQRDSKRKSPHRPMNFSWNLIPTLEFSKYIMVSLRRRLLKVYVLRIRCTTFSQSKLFGLRQGFTITWNHVRIHDLVYETHIVMDGTWRQFQLMKVWIIFNNSGGRTRHKSRCQSWNPQKVHVENFCGYLQLKKKKKNGKPKCPTTFWKDLPISSIPVHNKDEMGEWKSRKETTVKTGRNNEEWSVSVKTLRRRKKKPYATECVWTLRWHGRGRNERNEGNTSENPKYPFFSFLRFTNLCLICDISMCPPQKHTLTKTKNKTKQKKK